jgi:hypothetical protein
MTITDLIAKLQALPGDNSIRPFVVSLKLQRPLNRGAVVDFGLDDVEVDVNVVRASAYVRDVDERG